MAIVQTDIENKPFRDYSAAKEHVKNLYRQNHENQTLQFVLEQKEKYKTKRYCPEGMSVWDALELLDQIVDESDPDTEASQIVHALQSAEACRSDNQPDWMIVTTLIHDLGKILYLMGEQQWAVVGDTFPVGCQYSDKIVYHETLKKNPDFNHPLYSKKYGIYKPNIGFDNVHFSWGHDEYLYMVMKDYLPKEALYVIRYHSFYPGHRENEYKHLMNEYDEEMMKYVRTFNKYDLYSKRDEPINVEKLKPFYQNLLSKFFPDKIAL